MHPFAPAPHRIGFCASLACWQNDASAGQQKTSKALVASTSEVFTLVWDCIKCGVFIFVTIKSIFPSSASLRSVNQLISAKAIIMTDYEVIKDMLFSSDALETEEKELLQEMEVVSDLMRDAINENARVAIEQMEFQNRCDSLVKRFDYTKAKNDALCIEMDDKRIRRGAVEQFLADLAKKDSLLTVVRGIRQWIL